MTESEQSLERAEQKAKQWWESWSDTFQQAYDEAETEVGIAFGPGVPNGDDLGLFGDIDGKRAIELGCGGAQFGLALSKAGAEVTGVDISENQLAHARDLADKHDEDIDLIEASVTDMPMVSDASYDLAFSAFAFQWVNDIQSCFSEAHRVLKSGGKLVFSVDHPFYRCLNPETGELAVSYFTDSPRREYSEEFDAEMIVYRRTVSEIVTALLEVGFSIEELREPGYEDPEKYESEFGGFQPDRMARIPPTLVIAAEK
ncbi:class I SAM-dependent methyltransferase [Natronobacterium texcoconense]|uniref:Ubiquinone/menaquinone biosynthesis C-methylase UbiE n=1 Tax=Natronobacterium texcoconense TaxID=1095778 RepID=A0A1H1AP49_NATTX|nr:class I SAM-dependent methyltransferase [Natronobacterium texcoconense]SDQ40946.1 Ubiquinone/menaquinone biosynthesis C-methylase UbiE [Natronobacterium texcoconense]